jgi:hypothetical protein
MSTRKGAEYNFRIRGICGRILPKPPSILLDEIYQTHEADGWTAGVLPHRSNVTFIDVSENNCISEYEKCDADATVYRILAGAFGGFTLVCIILTSIMDVYVDGKLRAAARYAS